ncbi:MAG TPA: PaaI family thioesterase [Kofleriaceae bacterium]|nr:PaaI family thioesterase [Kofleriaceae bacterium]
MPKMTIAELEALMDQGFPDWRSFSQITALGERDITLRMPFRPTLLRAGGTISGPALMGLADTAAYLCTLAQAGPLVSAATANLDIHFLTRPEPVDVTAIATMLRLGRRLSVCAVDLWSGDALVAHATVTYALPPAAR